MTSRVIFGRGQWNLYVWYAGAGLAYVIKWDDGDMLISEDEYRRVLLGECPGCVTKSLAVAKGTGTARQCIRCAVRTARTKNQGQCT